MQFNIFEERNIEMIYDKIILKAVWYYLSFVTGKSNGRSQLQESGRVRKFDEF